MARFSAKIGLSSTDDEAWALVESLLELMHGDGVDFTTAFRRLAGALDGGSQLLLDEFQDLDAARAWLADWRAYLQRRGVDPVDAAQLMLSRNPVLIPRNHRIEAVIASGNEGNFEPFHRLHAALENPYREQPNYADYETPPRPEEEVQATFCGT
jgi:uncharacterized protein YdiU (UPF0061 family)